MWGGWSKTQKAATEALSVIFFCKCVRHYAGTGGRDEDAFESLRSSGPLEKTDV